MRTAASVARRRFAVTVCLCVALLAAGAARGAGPVVAWGAPPKVIASAIAAGNNHTCAIKADTGAVVCWGDERLLIAPMVLPSSIDGTSGGATAISARGDNYCAIQARTGAVVCWSSMDGQPAPTPPPAVDGTAGSASAIAAGFAHACAIQSGTGAVICWNYSSVMPVPRSVDGTGGTASAIASGSSFSCAIQSGSGAVICWEEFPDLIPNPPPSVNGTSGTATAITAGAPRMRHSVGDRRGYLLGNVY